MNPSDPIQSPSSPLEQQYSLSHAAKLLGICRRTIDRLIQRGHLPKPVKVGARSMLTESDIHAFQVRTKERRGR